MSRRIERLNSLIRQEISELLQRHVKDPRLSGLITVTEVSVSRDLRHARVMVSVIGSQEEETNVFVALAAASGFLRREISKRLDLRHTPELSFHHDESICQAAQVLQLINQVATTETGEKGAGER